jgi:uncharacterized membrane protein YhhN
MMSIIDSLFIIVILLLISVSVYAKYYNKKKLFFIVKPLTMIFIIALPLLEVREDYSPYAYLIISGLIISLLGDLFLLYPDKYFTNGLYSFFLAHVLYILAFNLNVNQYSLIISIPILAFVTVVTKVLSSKLGGYKYPVFGYILIISTMLYSALNFDLQAGMLSYIGIGAILFTISDTVLAFNKFYIKLRISEPIILSSYFIAQLLFVLTI